MNTHENYHNTDYNMLLPISTDYATKWAKEQLSFQRIWAYTIIGKDCTTALSLLALYILK